MHIVMVASECAPLAKVGGLADVVAGLSSELASREGVRVEIVLPKYNGIEHEALVDCRLVREDLPVPFFSRAIPCRVFEAGIRDLDPSLRVLLIDPRSEHRFFEREDLYGYDDDVSRFACFARATLELLVATGRSPHVVHCHDWQAGLVPVLLRSVFGDGLLARTRTFMTLHNVHHQGVADESLLRQVGLDPSELAVPQGVLHHSGSGQINQLKGGIVFSDMVTTVSRTYAEEIRTSHLGCGLQPLLQKHRDKLQGVLNGIDRRIWNPREDPNIPATFDIDTIDRKEDNKKALRERLWLRHGDRPIVAVVSRLDQQKGCHLMRHGMFTALRHGAQFVLLGRAPDPDIEREFRVLKAEFNDNPDCHLELAFDEELAHLIYAGCEMVLIPSRYEPCGLTQMLAMRYGTVPIARETGGLAETVFDANYSGKGYHEVNGYTFKDEDEHAVDSALIRAIGLWYQHPEYFRQLQINGMRYDTSWRGPADRYLDLYQRVFADHDAAGSGA